MSLASLSGGAGGLSASSSASARSGDAAGQSGSGNKVFNFGANPAAQSLAAGIGNPIVLGIIAVVIGLVIWARAKKR